MGKRSDRRKFRRRRRWAGFFLLVSLAVMAFSVMLVEDMISPDVQTTASRSVDKVGVARVASVRVAEAPEAASGHSGDEATDEAEFLASEEENKKTVAEKTEVERQASQKADEKEAARDQAAQQAHKSDSKPDPEPSGTPEPR